MTALLNLNRRHRTPYTSITIGNEIHLVEGLLREITSRIDLFRLIVLKISAWSKLPTAPLTQLNSASLRFPLLSPFLELIKLQIHLFKDIILEINA